MSLIINTHETFTLLTQVIMSTVSENQWNSCIMSLYGMANFSFIAFQLASIMIKWIYFFHCFICARANLQNRPLCT